MKKNFSITVLVIAAALALSSCAQQPREPEGTLSELMDRIYASVGEEITTERTELTADNAAYYLGTDGIPFTEALASEPMIGAIPHSVVLLRLEKNADVEAVKTTIGESADPNKWICASVEPDKVIVDNLGSLVILVMANNSGSYLSAFYDFAK